MRPATARRLLVFAVCAVGVSALYWAPSVAGTHGGLRTEPSPEPAPVPRPAATATEPDGASPVGPRTAPVGQATEPVTRRRQPEQDEVPVTSANEGRDDTVPPDTVADVRVVATTPDTLTLRWDETEDDTGVVAYQVSLNGFDVTSTSDPRATVDWFNNDSPLTTVQVSALDAAGNKGLPSSTVLAERPTAKPTAPTTSPSPSPSGSSPAEDDEAAPAPTETTPPPMPEDTPEALPDETPDELNHQTPAPTRSSR